MESYRKVIFFIILGIILVKTALVSLVPAPSEFSDVYIYSKMAWSFFNFMEFSIHGVPTSLFPPLYPILLSVSYIFKDMVFVYWLMKVINVILSSLIFIPAYLLSKEFFNEKRSIIIGLLVSLLPGSFAFSGYIMAENLLYPLVLSAFYLIYRSFNEEGYKFDILAGIFIGLSFLTKVTSIMLLVLVFFYFCYKFSLKQAKKKVVLGLFFFLTVLPWIIRNGLLFGFNFSGILGHYSKEASLTLNLLGVLPNVLSWFLLYISFIVLGSGIILFLMSLNTLFSKDKKVKDFSIFVFFSLVILSGMLAIPNISAVSFYETFFPWLLGRPVGRYIDVLLPLFIILGVLGFEKYKEEENWFNERFLITSIFVLIGSTLLFFPLYPVNNMTLTWLGVLNSLLGYLYGKGLNTDFFLGSYIILMIILLIAVIIIYYLHYLGKLKLRNILPLLFVFFIVTSLGVYGVNVYNSKKYWDDGELMKTGKWLNKYDNSEYPVLIDDKYEGKIWKEDQSSLYEGEGNNSVTVVGFFINNEIRIGDVENVEGFKYVISKGDLNLKLVHEEGDVKVYENG